MLFHNTYEYKAPEAWNELLSSMDHLYLSSKQFRAGNTLHRLQLDYGPATMEEYNPAVLNGNYDCQMLCSDQRGHFLLQGLERKIC
jgi:hypothetical protein